MLEADEFDDRSSNDIRDLDFPNLSSTQLHTVETRNRSSENSFSNFQQSSVQPLDKQGRLVLANISPRIITNLRVSVSQQHSQTPTMPADQTIRGIAGKAFDGAGLRIAIVAARWNPAICDTLTAGAKETLEKAGAEVVVERVAGAYELPAAAQALQKHFDGVIAIGCLVKGETMHFEYIAEAVTHGIMRWEEWEFFFQKSFSWVVVGKWSFATMVDVPRI